MNDDGVEPQAGHLNFANDLALRQYARLGKAHCLLEFLNFERLIRVRVGESPLVS